MSSALNYPLLSIPAYYVFSLLPHMYASYLLTSSGYYPNNANPKASLSPSAVQGKVPETVFHTYQRAENAQSNNNEQMPIYAVAILASLMAERATARGIGNKTMGEDVTGLTTFIMGWFAIRAAYNVAYINISDHSMSFIRSACWAGGLGLAVYQIYKAAEILGA